MLKDASNPYRQLPSVDELLRRCDAETERWGRTRVRDCLRAVLEDRRREIASGREVELSAEICREELLARLGAGERPGPVPVYNLTGTVVHTNLGRAGLPASAVEAVARVAGTACNLEFDLDTGERGDRESHVESLLRELTGAEAATVVNNNAAAVLLVLNTLAPGREVPVSRGELVEIGDSFRMPEVMQRSGCTLVEVGSTNRTHPRDYENAINDDTALLMKVHTSNYRVAGFTAAVSETQLARLAAERDIPLVCDLGSGCLVDFAALGLPAEPTASDVLGRGADLVTFSGDKLLGGPQCGIIAGRADLVARVRRNPLKRTLRPDKMTLAALAEVLRLYRHPERLLRELPTLRLLTRPVSELRALAERLRPRLAAVLTDVEISIEACRGQIGSGALPVENIPSVALRLAPASGEDRALRALARSLRGLPTPVIGRIHKAALWLDLRCLEDEAGFLAQLESPGS